MYSQINSNNFSKRYHVRKPQPFYIQPMPKPRFEFRDINRERLKKISLSASSLPPVGLFPVEDLKKEQLLAITDGSLDHQYYHTSSDNVNDELYNFYDDDHVLEPRHKSLEYFDDFYPVEDQHYLDLMADDDDSTNVKPHVTATTTIASFRCTTQYQQQTTVAIYQHTRASSL